jgi:YaiO family outer membrane protein
MNKTTFYKAGLLAAASCLGAQAAHAQEDGDAPEQTVQIYGEIQDFSDGYGSLDSVKMEYKLDMGRTTVVLTPAVGRRKARGNSDTAFGIGGALYHRFSDDFSTRTYVAIAEDEPVFANRDVAQDFTVRVAKNLTATVGGRWARYYNDRDVYFASGGMRYYFKGGSISYRLSYVDPDGRDSFLAHLVNVSINDGDGRGKTQLWLSKGEASINQSQLQTNFDGDDYGAFLRRVQPITKDFSLIGLVGISSYDRPSDRVNAVSVGLGIELSL